MSFFISVALSVFIMWMRWACTGAEKGQQIAVELVPSSAIN